jgi:hypothetical protein
MAGACSTKGRRGTRVGWLVGKSEGIGPLERPRRRWVDNIRMDLIEVGWGDVNWECKR